MLIRRFAEGLGIFSVVLRMPDNAIDSIERQPMPEGELATSCQRC